MGSTKWWRQDKAMMHSEIFEVATQLDNIDDTRQSKLLNYARMYSNTDLMGLDPYNYFAIRDYDFFQSEDARMRWNVIASVVDTLVARIAKNKPRVVLLPNRNTEVQRKAQDLEKFIDGAFNSTDIYRKAPISFLHACIGGTGVIHIFEDDGNVEIEVVPPHEILIDPHESMYGSPRQLMRRKHVEKELLAEQFPKAKGEIMLAGQFLNEDSIRDNSVSELVTVIEAWHLPSRPGAKDGRHVIAIDSAVLFEESWQEDDFPFEFIRWKEPIFGFWGTGVVSDIIGIQLEINDTLDRIQQAHYKLSAPLIFINSASAISKAHINNKIGAFVPYTGEVPKVQTFQTVHPEIYQHLMTLKQSAYEIAGVSQMSAQSKNILGPNASGEAIRQMSDVESERFALVSQAYEKFYLRVAKKLIRLARSLYQDGQDLDFAVHGKEFLTRVAWSEVDMDDDQYDLKVGAASILPDTKAGRISTALELLQMGVWTAEQTADALDVSDISSERELQRAPRDFIKEVVDMIINKGVVIEPEKYDDLVFAFKYAMMSYNKARLNGAPEENLELLRQYIDKVEFLLTPPEPTPEEMAMAEQQQGEVPQSPVGALPPGAPVIPPGG